MSFTATIVGNISQKRELRRVGRDKTPVIDFSVAIQHRKQDGKGGWKDGTVTFQRVTVWRKLAENFDEAFEVGDRIIVTGDITTGEDFKNRDGDEITPDPVLNARTIGADIQFGNVEIEHKKKSKSKSSSSRDEDGASKRTKKSRKPEPEDDVDDSIDGDDDDFFSDESF